MQLTRESQESHADAAPDFHAIDHELEGVPLEPHIDEFAPEVRRAETTVVPWVTPNLPPVVPSNDASIAQLKRIAPVVIPIFLVLGAGVLAWRFLDGRQGPAGSAGISRSALGAGQSGTVTFGSKPDGVEVVMGET